MRNREIQHRMPVVRVATVAACALFGCAVATASAGVPGQIEVTCDVNRVEFRRNAQGLSQVCFRLWSAVEGGAQIGSDFCTPMPTLTAVRVKTESFDGQGSRSFVRLSAVIGSDFSPVPVPLAGEAWLEVAVGPQTFGCEFVTGTSQRRRVSSVLFARGTDGSGGSGVPPGTIVAYGGTVVPEGWLPCDASAVSRTTYADLFAAIGMTYGTGNGASTFNLPDLRGRVAVGQGTGGDVDSLGDSDGVGAVASRTPKHVHTVNPHSHVVDSHIHHVDIWSGGEAFNFWSPSHRYPAGSSANYDNFAHGHGVVGDTWAASPGTSPASPGTNAQGPSYLTIGYIIKF